MQFIGITSIVKSQSGDGARFFSTVSLTDGEPLGSSGITANRPRCTHGDVAPYVAVGQSRAIRISKRIHRDNRLAREDE